MRCCYPTQNNRGAGGCLCAVHARHYPEGWGWEGLPRRGLRGLLRFPGTPEDALNRKHPTGPKNKSETP